MYTYVCNIYVYVLCILYTIYVLYLTPRERSLLRIKMRHLEVKFLSLSGNRILYKREHSLVEYRNVYKVREMHAS